MTSRILNELCNLLDTYKGRDKIIRTVCYSSKLIGGLTNNEAFAKKMAIFSSKMSSTRAALRLFDDLPMLKYSLEYGLGHEEPDQLMASIGVTANLIDQLYYPIEKIAWLAENKLISADGDRWDTISSIFWVASIYLTLMRSVRYAIILQQHKSCENGNSNVNKIIMRQSYELLTCIRLSLDLIHAVNTLPKGWLWGTKLKVWHVGLIATTSSILGLYQIFAKRSLSN